MMSIRVQEMNDMQQFKSEGLFICTKLKMIAWRREEKRIAESVFRCPSGCSDKLCPEGCILDHMYVGRRYSEAQEISESS